MRMCRWVWLTAGWSVALALAACSSTGNPSPIEPESSPESKQEAAASEEPSKTPPGETTVDRAVRLTPTLPKGIERVPPVESTPVTGEVPDDFLNLVIDDLIAKEQVDRDAIEVIRAESVVWSDGSLGCPEPGVMYTQALVNGYWIILRIGGKTYDYRVTSGGYFLLCENRLPGLPENQAPTH